ncbi:unknown protein [Seminavis robusta]|uniref:Uncharacterized protein n=1 Tax=Seminavis robusta TaxID=568900 RepID=A0A9N8EP89_9STRA|nr:unknown protein [Seminavis robusta]|eukprot:Sro1275_g258520.1 n/a (228) ;mRNA; r:30923-31704
MAICRSVIGILLPLLFCCAVAAASCCVVAPSSYKDPSDPSDPRSVKLPSYSFVKFPSDSFVKLPSDAQSSTMAKRKGGKGFHRTKSKKHRSKDERVVWARQQQQLQQAALQTPHAVSPHVNTGPFHNEDIDGVLPPPVASLRSAARKPTPTEQPDDERLNEILGPPSDDEPPSDEDDTSADLRLTPEEMESFLREYWIGNQGRSWDEDAEANQEYLRRHQLLCQERP